MKEIIKDFITSVVHTQKFLNEYQYNRIDNFKSMVNSSYKKENGTKIECYLDCVVILHGTKKIKEKTWKAKTNELDG